MDGPPTREGKGKVSSGKSFFEALFQKDAPHLYSEPLETPTLLEVGEENLRLPLSSGEFLLLESDDIKRLKQLVPKYLYGKTHLPLHFKLVSTNPIRVRIVGGEWQKRVIHYMLKGRLEWKPPEELGEEEFSTLLKMLRSLVHLSLERGGW